jgi:lycopene beta-cyclase
MMTQKNQFDFVFAGGGMAAASLLLRMLERPELASKSILIADTEAFNGREKTWCFWEKGNGFFESLIDKSWEKAWFHSTGFSKELNLYPFRYKMLRSEALFSYTIQQIARHPNIRIIASEVCSIDYLNQKIQVTLKNGEKFDTRILFNSIPAEPEKKPDHFYLLQHFRGWFIRTSEPVFNPDSATLMDFRIDQGGDCRFVYVLPSTGKDALVEYTVFSETLLNEEDYEKELSAYLKDLIPGGYEISKKEHGVIPMYSDRLPCSGIPGLVPIGTRGGMTKASTGYTFMKAQKHAEAIIRDLIVGRTPDKNSLKISKRFAWFDRVLLRILAKRIMPGRDIFKALFQKNRADSVFRFLDEESTFLEELKIMNAVPSRKFILPGLHELWRKS